MGHISLVFLSSQMAIPLRVLMPITISINHLGTITVFFEFGVAFFGISLLILVYVDVI